MFHLVRLSTKILFLAYGITLSTNLFGQIVSDLETQHLYKINKREQSIYRRLEANPDFYTAGELKRHLEEVVLAYKNYLLETPDDVSALILYGKLLRRIGRYDEAFKIFLKADALDTKIAVVKQQIGNYLAETGNGKAALAFYFSAIELEPETPEYHHSLGEILCVFQSEFIQDRVFTSDALDREMLKAFQTSALLEPNNFDAQMRLGEAYYDLITPDWKAALLHWDKLYQSTSLENTLRRQILGLHKARVLGKLGRNDEAKALAATVTQAALQKSRQQVLDEIAQN